MSLLMQLPLAAGFVLAGALAIGVALAVYAAACASLTQPLAGEQARALKAAPETSSYLRPGNTTILVGVTSR